MRIVRSVISAVTDGLPSRSPPTHVAKRTKARVRGGRAPVSAPIRWEELDDPTLAPDRWTIRNVVERVAEVGDLFAPAQTDHQALPAL